MALPSIKFAAPPIRAAIASLQAGLPAQVAVFNAEAANTVDVAAPANENYVFGAFDPLVLFPAIEVAAMQGTTGAWSVDRVQFDHDVMVNVVVWHEGDRGEVPTTYEMSLGLARCVIEVLCETDAFGPTVEIAQDAGIFWRADVMPADLTDDGRDFRKWRVPVFLQFKLEQVETRS